MTFVTMDTPWLVYTFDYEHNGNIPHKILYIKLFSRFCYCLLFSFCIGRYQIHRQFYVRVRLGLAGQTENSGVFFLKTMQFRDFDSIVVDPCCVKDKNNIQKPLPVYRGGLLGNCWDETSGGNGFINTFLVGAPDGDDRTVRTTGKGQVIDFFVLTGTTTMPLRLIDRKTRDGEQRSLQKRTRSKRRRDHRMEVFFSPVATSDTFPESSIGYFSTKFSTMPRLYIN